MEFLTSIANTVLLGITLSVFFGIMAGVWWMNKQERECERRRKEKQEEEQ